MHRRIAARRKDSPVDTQSRQLGRCPVNAHTPRPTSSLTPEDFERLPKTSVSRRSLLKLGLAGAAATTLAGIDTLTWLPKRLAQAAPAASSLPDIQFDIGNFIAPAQTLNGVLFRFGPIYSVFLTARLNWTPTRGDQADLSRAL